VRDDGGAISTGALVAVALVIAAVVGLIAGGVWGQIGNHATTSTGEPTSTASTTSPTATSGSPSQSPTTTPTPPTSTPSGTTGPGPTPTGAAPSAPATTTTVVDGWRLGAWKITTTGGTLGVDTTARNTGTATSSANLVLYVYINGALIATTTATVTDVAAGASVPVHFSGSDPWKPGQKVLLLALA
jgi:hypothetical protein